MDDYAAWVRTIDPKFARHSLERVLKPMWENPDHPAIATAAESLFEDPASGWTKMFLRGHHTHGLFDTPMLGVAGFRNRIQTKLADQRPAGKIILDKAGHGSLQVENSYSGGPSTSIVGDSLAPPLPAEVGFRVCDYYAWNLSRLAGLRAR